MGTFSWACFPLKLLLLPLFFKHFPSYDVSKVDEERKVAAVSEFYKKAAENPIADVDAGRLLLSGGINHNVAGLNIFDKPQYCWFKHFLINHNVAGLNIFR